LSEWQRLRSAYRQKKLIQLFGTARRIWEILEYLVKLDEIARILAAEFSAKAEAIAKKTEPFMESLTKKGRAPQ